MALSQQALVQLLIKAFMAPTNDAAGALGAEIRIDTKLASGTGANQATKLIHDVRSLGNGANEDLDLTTMLDVNGAAASLTGVKVFCIQAAAANTADIRISDSSASPWAAFLSSSGATDDAQIDLQAGATLLLIDTSAAGYAVAGGSKAFNVENLAGAATAAYTITVIGI